MSARLLRSSRALFLVHRCDVQTRRGIKQYLGSKVTVKGNDKHRTTMALALNGIIGHSTVMQELTNLVLKVAPHNCTVLSSRDSCATCVTLRRSRQTQQQAIRRRYEQTNE